MEQRALLAGMFVAILLILPGCLSPAPAPHVSFAINATPGRYNPAMSSTIGIRLTPVNTSGIIPPGALFTWETTYGTFSHWGPPGFRVIELGTPYTGDDEPVYWSYFPGHGGKEQRPVTITLTVREPGPGAVLGNATLHVGWEDPQGFTAIVGG